MLTVRRIVHIQIVVSLSPGKTCVADKASSSRDNVPASPDYQDGNADNLGEDQEAGWSLVGPRRKKRIIKNDRYALEY